MNEKMPKRKHTRLKDFDYSTEGEYFITICTHNKQCILSDITTTKDINNEKIANITLTQYGEVVKQQLLLLEERFPFLTVDKYVIMPNHIHIVLTLNNKNKTHTTISDIICVFKSLTVKECKKLGYNKIFFQTSFYEHIIRNYNDYEQTINYINENPIKWNSDILYLKDY